MKKLHVSTTALQKVRRRSSGAGVCGHQTLRANVLLHLCDDNKHNRLVKKIKEGSLSKQAGERKTERQMFPLMEASHHQRAMCETFPLSFRTFNGLL